MKTHEVGIGSMKIGGTNPIAVQSMTNTDTADVQATVAQIKELVDAGSELVRVTVNTEAAASSVPKIKQHLLSEGITAPLIGDFHYNGHLLLQKYPACASSLDKYRINPGNVGFGNLQDKNFRQIIGIAIDNSKPVRIGVNWGSLDQQLLKKMMDENASRPQPLSSKHVLMDTIVQSALISAEKALDYGMSKDKIVLSAKVSDVNSLITVYRSLSRRTSQPLHLGLTEAGQHIKGIVSSAAALSVLLQENIGDTIRVSLTPSPASKRSDEVMVARQILQSLNIRRFAPDIASCPGCGRTSSSLFQKMAHDMNEYVAKNMPSWKKQYPGVENMTIAVMGCIVNGPGESKHANIGISLPGTGENPRAPVFIDGRQAAALQGPNMMQDFKQIVEDYIRDRYQSATIPIIMAGGGAESCLTEIPGINKTSDILTTLKSGASKGKQL